MTNILDFLKSNMWVVKIAIGFAVLIFSHILIKFIIKIIKTKADFAKKWNKKLDYIFLKPFMFLIWILVSLYVMGVVFLEFDMDALKGYLAPIRDGSIVAFIAWLIFRWKNVIHSSMLSSNKKKVDFATLHLISKLSSIIIGFIALLIILQIFGIDIMPLIAFGGVGAAALGLAAKDVIANFFGGLMIYITRPFTKDDFIEIPKENILGTVENIGWYLTCIRDLDQCPIYIPNALFSTAQMKNKTRRTHRKIEETVSVRYVDFAKIDLITKDIKELLKKSKDIDSSLDFFVCFTTFGAYSLDILFRAYAFPTGYKEFMEIKEGVLFEINKIIKSHCADIPFPTTTIEMENLIK